jgi:hypothetical protein
VVRPRIIPDVKGHAARGPHGSVEMGATTLHTDEARGYLLLGDMKAHEQLRR